MFVAFVAAGSVARTYCRRQMHYHQWLLEFQNSDNTGSDPLTPTEGTTKTSWFGSISTKRISKQAACLLLWLGRRSKITKPLRLLGLLWLGLAKGSATTEHPGVGCCWCSRIGGWSSEGTETAWICRAKG